MSIANPLWRCRLRQFVRNNDLGAFRHEVRHIRRPQQRLIDIPGRNTCSWLKLESDSLKIEQRLFGRAPRKSIVQRNFIVGTGDLCKLLACSQIHSGLSFSSLRVG
jgi:hypothetical protein